MKALLEAAPASLRRPVRSLCRMLGLEPPPILALPPRPKRPVDPARPADPARPRAPRRRGPPAPPLRYTPPAPPPCSLALEYDGPYGPLQIVCR